MDRFIEGGNKMNDVKMIVFKIQYGQIYSVRCIQLFLEHQDLKSSMDRFIELRNSVNREFVFI